MSVIAIPCGGCARRRRRIRRKLQSLLQFFGFDAFDESPLGAFFDSGFDARSEGGDGPFIMARQQSSTFFNTWFHDDITGVYPEIDIHYDAGTVTSTSRTVDSFNSSTDFDGDGRCRAGREIDPYETPDGFTRKGYVVPTHTSTDVIQSIDFKNASGDVEFSTSAYYCEGTTQSGNGTTFSQFDRIGNAVVLSVTAGSGSITTCPGGSQSLTGSQRMVIAPDNTFDDHGPDLLDSLSVTNHDGPDGVFALCSNRSRVEEGPSNVWTYVPSNIFSFDVSGATAWEDAGWAKDQRVTIFYN